MGTTKIKSFEIRRIVQNDVAEVLAFHQASVGVHLMPRDAAFFERLVEEKALYAAVEVTDKNSRLSGICYIAEPEKATSYHHEFGGVFVRGKHRGLGLASVLGKCAIANRFAFDLPLGRLIAHVHELNDKPRGMLQNQLGFVRSPSEDETVPDEYVPPSMEKNSEGKVIGHLFVFSPGILASFADWIESFDGTITGSAGKANLHICLEMMSLKEQTLTALRDLAANWPV